MPDVHLRLADADDYGRLFVFQPLQSAVLGTGESLDRADFEVVLNRLRTDKSVVLRVVEHEGEIVGLIVATDTGHVPHVSFWIDPARWNQGFATAALLAFTTMMKRRPLQARTSIDNPAAIRVLEKAGFARIEGQPAPTNADTATGELTFELGFFPAATFIGTTAS